MEEFPSQLGQDRFVLERFGHRGFFLEIGAYHVKELSNTFALEKAGWKGISIDPFPKGDWVKERPNTILLESVLSSHGEPVRFIKGNELGGDEKHIGNHSHSVKNCDRVIIPSKTPRQLFEEYRLPKRIEYVSIDVEGAEFEILKEFPFESVEVGCITVEHNFEEAKRSLIRQLLEKNGFSKVVNIDTRWDDWYINEKFQRVGTN